MNHRLVVVLATLTLTLALAQRAWSLEPSKASQLVTLTTSGAFCPGTNNSAFAWDQRVNSDGTVKPFTIPNKMVLIVTDIDWRQGLPTGTNQPDELFVYQANPASGGTLVDSVGVASDGESGADVAVSGVAVKAGHQLCFQVNSGNLSSADAVLHGFLAPDN
jgi:hypothetical protein